MKNKIILFLLLLFSLVVGIIISEIILRTIGLFHTYSEKTSNIYSSPYEVGFEGHVYALLPNNYKYHYRSEFEYEVISNSVGLRDKEHEKAKKVGQKRVIILGDSFVEGVGAEFDSTWVQQMQHKMNIDSLLFINGGVSGSDLFFGYELLKQRLLQYKPDNVLLTINQSDFEDYIVRGGLSRYAPNEKVVYNSPFEYENWYRKYHVVRLIVHNLLDKDWHFLNKEERNSRLERSVNDFFEVITKYQKLSTDNDFKFSVVFYPIPSDFSYKIHNPDIIYHIRQMNLIIEQLANTNIHYIDLADCITEKIDLNESLDKYSWPIDGHYNSKGYNLLSECTLKELFDNNFLLDVRSQAEN